MNRGFQNTEITEDECYNQPFGLLVAFVSVSDDNNNNNNNNVRSSSIGTGSASQWSALTPAILDISVHIDL